jgi:hypothetical protein
MARNPSVNPGRASAAVVSAPPRLVSDEKGQIVEVILGYEEYRNLLRLLAKHADWDTLSPSIQDAIDNFLADEALAEEGEAIPLRQALAETGDLPA